MGGNRFLQFGAEFGFDEPRRVYARLDQSEGERVYLEAIDADWFDIALRSNADFRNWVERSPDAPIYVLETDVKRYVAATGFRHYEKSEDRFEDEEHDWVEITIQSGGNNALIYPNLFVEGRLTGIAISPFPPPLAQELAAAFSLDDYVVDQRRIERALASLQDPIEWIGVYDVGQGSAAGLCDRRGLPLAYFDLGGGVLGNVGTFPGALHNFCFTWAPPIILSHWDWDHWSSGARFTRSMAMTWIVPNQTLGAVHPAQAGPLRPMASSWSGPLPYPRFRSARLSWSNATAMAGTNPDWQSR
jgi:hypothetical protein